MKKYSALDDDGTATIGAPLGLGDIVFNKYTPIISHESQRARDILG